MKFLRTMRIMRTAPKLIVGLGNPGKEYELTRHNIGWRVVDHLAQQQGVRFVEKHAFHCTLAKMRGALLCKPLTYMNNSGQAVRMVADYYHIPISDVMLVYDDKDLPLGTIRLRSAGSSGGHNGVQSVIQHLGTQECIRIRLGVAHGQPIADTAHFVLQRFSAEEEKIVSQLIPLAVDVVEKILTTGFASANHKDIIVV